MVSSLCEEYRARKRKCSPIMSISIAVVISDGGRLKHYGEVSEIAS